MPSSVNSCSNSDVESDTSTLVYDHESFTTYQSRILEFALENVWPDAAAENIILERLQGGGFNRIIGITRQKDDQADPTEVQYILRLPRFDAAQVDSDVAILCFLEQHTQMPTPKVIAFDDTDCNRLESPYMIQHRIKGVDTLSTFPSLDHSARLKFAREMGNVFREMLGTQSSMAGTLTFSVKDKSLLTPFHITPFAPQDPQQAVPYHNSATNQTVLELLTANFKAQTAFELKHYPDDVLTPHMMERFCAMALELDADGWFENVHNCLAHLDLAPRNILVDSVSNTQSPIISAVLDWDSAVFAPMFMACTPPLWIWDWQEDEEEDERKANDDPSSPEARQLKRVFEKSAGPEYTRFAYEPAYRLARRLVRFAVDGRIGSSEDTRQAKEMLEEWAIIHKERHCSH
ncbi:hypothetical protein F4819DRAFT_506880 [Hypoxylon fuscum]|nr:hypothetical protein F4819DRAFT_506880 [Hypoxylon fuscum]